MSGPPPPTAPLMGPQPAVRRAAPAPVLLTSLQGGRFLREHIDVMSTLTKGQLGPVTPEDKSSATKPYWLAYFWEEKSARPRMLRNHDALFADFFERMYVLPRTWDPSDPGCELQMKDGRLEYRRGINVTPVNALVLKPGAWTTIPDNILLAVLDALLDIGFEEAQPFGSVGAPFTQSDFIPKIDVDRASLVGKLDKAYFLGWRGDGRDLGTIRKSGGLINKTQSDYEDYARKRNLRAPWHPFAKPENQKKYFYRLGADDNCLESVVSVSTDFKTASTFPLLNGDYVRLPASIPSEQEIKNLDAGDQRKWFKVSDGTKTVIRFADRQQLYLVIVDTQYFDTKGRQPTAQKFPEVAVKEIPATGIFACVSFVRVHHGTQHPCGVTCVFDQRKSFGPTLDVCRRYCQSQKFAKQLYAHVKNLYDNAVASLTSTYHVIWTPTKADDVKPNYFPDDQGRAMTISAVKGWFSEPLYP